MAAVNFTFIVIKYKIKHVKFIIIIVNIIVMMLNFTNIIVNFTFANVIFIIMIIMFTILFINFIRHIDKTHYQLV